MDITEHHHCPYQAVEHEEDLAEVEAPPLVVDVVQESVREWGGVGDLLVSEGEAGGGGEKAGPEPEEAEEGFDPLVRDGGDLGENVERLGRTVVSLVGS